MNEHLLWDIVHLLGAAIIFVPITQRLGLGSVLGYLIAGLTVGPSVLGFVTNTESMAHVSEFGVVFLLFIIGLELEPKRLWDWRVPIFAMGFAQMVSVTAIVSGLAWSFGINPVASVIIGLCASMSSTAVASQILRDRNLMRTSGGSSAFSILLFQDIAVIPILALLPLLVGTTSEQGHGAPLWKIVAVLAAVVIAGQFLIRHVLRLVAGTHLREIFTALSLAIVIGLGALMHSLGLSMALGAFLGGVLLATSEYRHAIETDIEPFKGLLLGLFFMSVGMSVDLSVVGSQPLLVAAIVIGLTAIKMGTHGAIAKLFRISSREIPLFSILISQVGEFAFVLLGLARALNLLSNEETAIFSAAVALSMAVTPLLIVAYDRWWAIRLSQPKDMSGEVVKDDGAEVLIAGFGRVGQIVGRILFANRIQATVLDHDPEQIELLRQFGFKIYYGDATRLDLLEAAGAARAKVLVVAVDDPDDSLQIVDMAQEHFPHLKLVVRARNIGHVYDLIDREIHNWERETFDSSLRLGTDVLKLLGWEPYSAVKAAAKFRDHNLQMIFDLHAIRKDRARMTSAAKQAREDLEKMFTGEKEGLQNQAHAWDIHPEGR